MNVTQLRRIEAGGCNRVGQHPDPHKRPRQTADYDAAEILGVDRTPDRASARHLVQLRNQDPLNSCVLFAVAQAVRAAMITLGVAAPPWLSMLWGYLISRMLHGARRQDEGTFIRLAFQALAQLGFPPEHIWSYGDPTRDIEGVPAWQAQPSDRAQQYAVDLKGVLGINYRRIYDTGDALKTAIERAIAQHKLVVFGTSVSVAFAQNRHALGEYLDPPIGLPLAGGHALVVAEYTPLGGLGPNSWDEENDVNKWGEDGWFRFGWDYILHPMSRDFWVVDVAPLFVADRPTSVQVALNQAWRLAA